jgi:hypothetical protein
MNRSSHTTPDIKVVLRNSQGRYLARDDNGLFFTSDRSAAMMFGYQSDCVAEQLEILRQSEGVALVAEPVPLEEIYETCDRCKDLFVPAMISFDGKRFLCAECRKLVSPRLPIPTSQAAAEIRAPI